MANISSWAVTLVTSTFMSDVASEHYLRGYKVVLAYIHLALGIAFLAYGRSVLPPCHHAAALPHYHTSRLPRCRAAVLAHHHPRTTPPHRRTTKSHTPPYCSIVTPLQPTTPPPPPPSLPPSIHLNRHRHHH